MRAGAETLRLQITYSVAVRLIGKCRLVFIACQMLLCHHGYTLSIVDILESIKPVVSGIFFIHSGKVKCKKVLKLQLLKDKLQ